MATAWQQYPEAFDNEETGVGAGEPAPPLLVPDQAVAGGWKPVVRPLFGRDRVAGRNRLASLLARTFFNGAASAYSVSFQPLTGVAARHFPDSLPALELDWTCADEPVQLRLDEFAFQALIGPMAPLEGFLSLSGELQSALLHHLARDLSDAIARATGWSLSFGAARPCSTWEAAREDWPLLLWEQGSLAGRLLLKIPEALETRLGELAAPEEGDLPRPQLEQLPVRLRFTLPDLDLDHATLLDLAPGDVLLTARAGRGEAGIGYPVGIGLGPGYHFTGRFDGERIHVGNKRDGAMDERLISEANERYDDLPFRLSFHAGEKWLTLAELKYLQAGTVIELDESADAPVRISANGAFFGLGEMVQVGERLGVRLLEIRDGTAE